MNESKKQMLLLVQGYLLNHSLNELKEEHGIKHNIKEHKISLNYNLLETKEDDPIGKECRGLILTPVNFSGYIDPNLVLGQTKIMAYPFNRFYNYGQSEADKIDFFHDKTRFYEKMDGTLCILYYDFIKDEWCIATRAVSEADLFIDKYIYTFRSLFEKACLETTGVHFNDFVSKLEQNLTYMFELTSPINKIVVNYKKYEITLLGIKNNLTGEEQDPINQFNIDCYIPKPQTYSFSTLEDTINFVSSFDPQKHEGLVVCDQHFKRIKIKNPSYVAIHRIVDATTRSPRGLMKIILLEKFDDVMSSLPEHILNEGIELQQKLYILNKQYNIMYNDIINNIKKDKNERKNFALSVQRSNLWMGPMMDRYLGKSNSLIEWIKNKTWANNLLDQLISQLEKQKLSEEKTSQQDVHLIRYNNNNKR